MRKSLREFRAMTSNSAEGEKLLDDASNYDKDAYEKPSVTVDMCISRYIDRRIEVLLIKRKNPPFRDNWAIPGGFVDIDKSETLEEAAIRELEEETSITGVKMRQLGTYGNPDRDPRMRIITVVYYAIIPNKKIPQVIPGSDAKDYMWADIRNLPELVAFDHRDILTDFDNRLQGRLNYTTDAFDFVEKKFIWSELQEIYETIGDTKLVAPNFRRKINSIHSIVPVEGEMVVERGRPAQVFKLK
jgi:8-oxo-dGTP diphosphatase